jgi:hypothetical protein
MSTSSNPTSQILDDSKKLNGSGFKNFLAWFEAIAQICASRSQLSEPLRAIRNGFLPQEFLTYHPMLPTSVWVQTANNRSEHFGSSLKEPVTVAMLSEQMRCQARILAEKDSDSDSDNEVGNSLDEAEQQSSPRRLRSYGAAVAQGGGGEGGAPKKRKASEIGTARSPSSNSPVKSKPKISDNNVKMWILPEPRVREFVSNKPVRKAIEAAESSKAVAYTQHVTSLLDLMKANMTTAYRSAITSKPEYARAEGQLDLLQCWYWIKKTAILVSAHPGRFSSQLKQELGSSPEYKLAPAGDFNYHASRWLSLLMILQFVEEGDLATTEAAVVTSFVDSLPDEPRFSITTNEMRDDMRFTSDVIVSCRNSLASTIDRYNTTITKTMPTTPTLQNSGGQGGGGATPTFTIDKELKKAIVLAVKTELRSKNPLSDPDIDCRNYISTGACKFGDTCRYRHGAGDPRYDGRAMKAEYAQKVEAAIKDARDSRRKPKVYTLTQAQISQMLGQNADGRKPN